ncbi:hypothetical protein JZ751_017043 [Albula glossodonta]|uniref:Fibronectin type-III domain-containing protein n=1 Tax=Albula glossodonta TaxID=121402 RepID=A0A8T2P0A7_9TELE|nr:hypothetical protein JZ751_017043 [Albula glossodonta]
MIPSTSQDFLVKDLVSGREYDLCVLAVYDDGITSLTATRQPGQVTRSASKGAESQEEQAISSSGVGGVSGGGAAPSAPVKDSNTLTLVVDCEKVVQITEMTNEDVLSPTQRRQSRTCIELKRRPSLTAKEATSGEVLGENSRFTGIVEDYAHHLTLPTSPLSLPRRHLNLCFLQT